MVCILTVSNPSPEKDAWLHAFMSRVFPETTKPSNKEPGDMGPRPGSTKEWLCFPKQIVQLSAPLSLTGKLKVPAKHL